ncbi:MAG: hypothetical protein QF805_16905, partial [Pirellulaceae bacterium]|nr:hypothetical protein [Pirellulaceae bacterium]
MKELSTAELAEIVAAWAGTDPSARRERGRRGYQWAIGATSDQWRRFNALLLEQTPQARVAADLLLSVLFSAAEATLWTDESAREIYLTSDAGAALRRTMLFQWASRADEACLSEFCQLIVAAPPASSDDGAAVIAPLL